MFRDQSDVNKQTVTSINCLLTDAGLGDHVCYLVAIDYILKNYPWVNLLIWVPDYLLDFAKNVLPENAIVRNYSDATKKYDNTRIGISTKSVGQHTPMKVHPVDYAFHQLCDEHVTNDKKNYLKVKFDKIDIDKFNLPDKYVVIAATSAEKVKTMPAKTMNDISKYVISKGYTPVFVGKTISTTGYENVKMLAKQMDVDYSLGVNLIDKTSLLETAKIIEGSYCYIGMDGGISHIAGHTNTPIVVGYTFIDPCHNLPIRNNILGWNCYPIVPDESLKCRFCQTKVNFIYNHDYRDCFYKDYACVNHMTADKFIEQIRKIL